MWTERWCSGATTIVVIADTVALTGGTTPVLIGGAWEGSIAYIAQAVSEGFLWGNYRRRYSSDVQPGSNHREQSGRELCGEAGC